MTCDYCGAEIGFYGCPKHGVDCYDPAQHPDDPDECSCAMTEASLRSCPKHGEDAHAE
jgi:hypothetical protein